MFLQTAEFGSPRNSSLRAGEMRSSNMNCNFYCHVLTRMLTAAAGFLPFSLLFDDEPTQIIPTLAVFPVNSCGSAAAFFQCRSLVCMHVLIMSLSVIYSNCRSVAHLLFDYHRDY